MLGTARVLFRQGHLVINLEIDIVGNILIVISAQQQCRRRHGTVFAGRHVHVLGTLITGTGRDRPIQLRRIKNLVPRTKTYRPFCFTVLERITVIFRLNRPEKPLMADPIIMSQARRVVIGQLLGVRFRIVTGITHLGIIFYCAAFQ